MFLHSIFAGLILYLLFNPICISPKALIFNSEYSCSFILICYPVFSIKRCLHLAKKYCQSLSSAVTDHLLCHHLGPLSCSMLMSSDWGALLFLYSYLHSGMFGEQMSHVTWPLRAVLALGFCVCVYDSDHTWMPWQMMKKSCSHLDFSFMFVFAVASTGDTISSALQIFVTVIYLAIF